ncbi:MAG: nuclear transport factor 2 family protein [Thermomonas sp.]
MANRFSMLLAGLAVFAALGCASVARGGNPAEEDKVVDAMRTMYVAATNDDLEKFHEVAAPGFFAFDGGKRFGGDELMALVKDAHAAGKIYHWEVTQPEVHIDGGMAWIAYVNKGSVGDASGMTEMTWLESAVLRKERGAWRIVFFHSTRVPVPAK